MPGSVILENVSHASAKRWERFVVSLKMDEKLEFNEGDIGLAGGIQVLEPAGAHPVTTDSIKRYGGSTSPASQWPETANEVDIEDKGKSRQEDCEVHWKGRAWRAIGSQWRQLLVLDVQWIQWRRSLILRIGPQRATADRRHVKVGAERVQLAGVE